MKYDIILMDSDNTILNYSRSEKNSLFKALKFYNVRPSKKILKLYREINDNLWKMHERGEIPKSQIGKERFSRFLSKLEKDIDPSEFNDRYMLYLSDTRYKIKGAITLLKKLKKLGARVYIVTNGTDWIQQKRLTNSSVRPYLDEVFVSEKIGHSKPSEKYFNYCFNQIPNFDKSKTLLVGDSVTADVEGAINAKVDSCHFCPKGTPCDKATYSIKKLSKLINIVK